MYVYQPSFDLDLTGRNPKNLVKNEPHKLTKGKKNRALIPNHGLFYGGSLIIRDKSYELVRNVDYITIELHQDLTQKSGLAVFTAIVVLNREISDDIEITYQAVGGPYDRNNKAIANLYESVINDSRLIDWHNVSNKPSEFPPAEHYHPLNDIVNWTPIIHQLERVNMTIQYSHIDLNKKIIGALAADFRCHQLEYNFPSSNLVKYDAYLHGLSERKLLSALSVHTKMCGWNYGRIAHFDIDTSNYPIGHDFHWSFYKEDNELIHMEVPLHGVVKGNGGEVRVFIYVPATHRDEPEALYVGVTDKPFVDDYHAVSYKLQFHTPLYSRGIYPVMVYNKGFDTDNQSKAMYHRRTGVSTMRHIMDHLSSFELDYI